MPWKKRNEMPVNIEAEKAILGSILLEPVKVKNAILADLMSSDFSLSSNRRIWVRMLDLHQTDRAVDPITLVEELRRHNELEAIGGVPYVASLIDNAVPENITQYIEIIKLKAHLRKIIELGEVAEFEATQPHAIPHRIVQLLLCELRNLQINTCPGDHDELSP